MRKDNNKALEKVFQRLAELYKKIGEADWNNPRNILILLACVIMPFVAWYYISTGLVIALLMTISILWLLEKAPVYVKELIASHPLASNLIISGLAVMLVGGYFGSGLTLGISAVFVHVLLSWTFPAFIGKFKKEQGESSEATA